MNPLPATHAVEQYYLDARSKLLDLAAILDRIERGENTAAALADPRVARLENALKVLLTEAPNKAELVQQVFSLEYDPNWKRPQPRF